MWILVSVCLKLTLVKSVFLSTAFNFLFLVLLNKEFIMKKNVSFPTLGVSVQSDVSFVNEKDFFSSVENSRLTAGFTSIRKNLGLRIALKSFIVRYRYILKLCFIRESAIIRVLSQNFEKIPRWTMSRLIVLVYLKSAWLRRVLWKIENSLSVKNIQNI